MLRFLLIFNKQKHKFWATIRPSKRWWQWTTQGGGDGKQFFPPTLPALSDLRSWKTRKRSVHEVQIKNHLISLCTQRKIYKLFASVRNSWRCWDATFKRFSVLALLQSQSFFSPPPTQLHLNERQKNCLKSKFQLAVRLGVKVSLNYSTKAPKHSLFAESRMKVPKENVRSGKEMFRHGRSSRILS